MSANYYNNHFSKMSDKFLHNWLLSFKKKQNPLGNNDVYESNYCGSAFGLCDSDGNMPLCLRCRRAHMRSFISRIFSQIMRSIYKLAVRILGSDSKQVIKVGGLNRINPLIVEAISISKNLRDKESFKLQSRLVHIKTNLLIDHISELFFHYSYSQLPNQVNLMNETYSLISKVLKQLQPLVCKCEKNIKSKYLNIFYEKIMNERIDLYNYLSSLPTTEEKTLLHKFEKRRLSCKSEKSGNFPTCDHFNYDLSEGNCNLSHKSIDEIVEYIEGAPSQKKKRNRKKKKGNSDGNRDEDMEIIEFSRRIHDVKLGFRVKPMLTDEFLMSLKKQIEILKQSGCPLDKLELSSN